MNIENIRKNVNQFMNLLAEEGLIKVTGFDEKIKMIQANSNKRHELGVSSFKKIIDADEKSKILTDDEFSLLIFKFALSNLNEEFELVKIVLKAILNSDEIRFNERTTYGDLLGKCFDKLHYDKIRPIMRDIFQLDLRNAYTHLDYEINENIFSYHKMNGELVEVNTNEINGIYREFTETTETMVDFLNNYFNLKS